MTMKLYHARGSCSLGIRILLEEIGADYDLIELSFANGDQHKPGYLALNPKGKVPALSRPDGSLLTEFPVIAQWLAETYPQAQLLGDSPAARWRILETMEYVVSSLHMRGATLVFRANRFAPSPEAQAFLKEHALSVVREGFEQLEALLDGRESFFGGVTLADAAVFYLVNWHERLGLDLPAGLAAFHQRMMQRPSVQRALA